MSQRVYIVGTVDTKGDELAYIRDLVAVEGLDARVVDVSTRPHASIADISAPEVARHHPDGPAAVFTGDRGSAVAAMADAFARFIAARRDVAGMIGIGARAEPR